MRYNETISNEYGPSPTPAKTDSPIPYKPRPVPIDYTRGYITRLFVKRVNDMRIIEVQPEKARTLNQYLYTKVSINWKITGPQTNHISGDILVNTGVTESNRDEIYRVKAETGIDLSHNLSDILEFWSGR